MGVELSGFRTPLERREILPVTLQSFPDLWRRALEGGQRVCYPYCQSRGVAQPGSAPAWGAGGRQFKSGRPDHYPTVSIPGKSPHPNVRNPLLPPSAPRRSVPCSGEIRDPGSSAFFDSPLTSSPGFSIFGAHRLNTPKMRLPGPPEALTCAAPGVSLKLETE